ncbi:MAG TPA: hypothetical protein VFV46_06560 [Lacibacter sp.]|nr:hypothetical protein [Lacibacter sp.]
MYCKNLFIISSLAFFMVACEKETNSLNTGDECVPAATITAVSTAQQDMQLLNKLWDEIYAMSGSATCQRANEWGIVPVGSKPCGGAWTYIAYRLEIDINCFLRKVNYYNQQQKKYNEKYGIASDCMVEPIPKAVVCENGKPVFVY